MSTLSNFQAAGVNIFDKGIGKEVTDGSRHPYNIPGIYTVNNRNNSWATAWGSNDEWTTYYAYQNRYEDQLRTPWMALGQYHNNTLGMSNTDLRKNRKLIYASQSILGGEGLHYTYPQTTSYSPIMFLTMFVRNFHPTVAKTVTFYNHYSYYWSSGYDGSALLVVSPNGSYAGTNSCSYSNLWQRTGGSSNTTNSGSITIQPNRTVMVILVSTMYYWQQYSEYWFFEIAKFYSLEATFSDPWIQPDLKMTQAALTMNDMVNGDPTNNTAHRIWNRTAELYGDR